MSFHRWLGHHTADLRHSHWDAGHFVSRCTGCGHEMERLPGLAWQLRKA